VLVSLLSTLEIVYVVFLTIYIVLEKRSSAATLAWILGLAFLPIVGFVLYFFLGSRNILRKRMRHANARAEVRRTHGMPEASWVDLSSQLARLTSRCAGTNVGRAESVEVLLNGKACFDAIVDAIAEAKHHIHVEYYIFEEDQTGKRIRDALVNRAKEGVKVRLLVDGVGTSLSSNFLAPLLAEGAEFARFNPLRLGRLLPRINLRNHRKIVVIDGNVGFLGGINVGDEYNEEITKREAYRDTHLKLVGSVVREIQFTFLEDWQFSTGEVVRDKLLFPKLEDDADEREQELVQIVPSGPDLEWEATQKVYFTMITQAERTLRITTPYFVPDEAIQAALCSAGLRGVKVELIVPQHSDSRVVSLAARSYYDQLLSAGVHIYEYPKMVHAKTMVVDGKLACVGSANMDNRSFRLNFEIGAVFYDGEAITALDRAFDKDKARCRHVTSRSRNKLAWLGRFGEASARLLSPLL
jgi:cardiolipin synthase A/B